MKTSTSIILSPVPILIRPCRKLHDSTILYVKHIVLRRLYVSLDSRFRDSRGSVHIRKVCWCCQAPGATCSARTLAASAALYNLACCLRAVWQLSAQSAPALRPQRALLYGALSFPQRLIAARSTSEKSSTLPACLSFRCRRPRNVKPGIRRGRRACT